MIVWLSRSLLPLVIGYIVAFGLISGRPVFDDFLAGAKKGMFTLAKILPTYIGLMTAVGVLRASGFLDAAAGWLAVPLAVLRFPPELVPLTLVRLISSSAAVGLLLDLFRQYGPDSALGMTAAVILGSTETVFYCLSLYFGAAGITHTRYAVWGSLFATAAGIAAAVFLCMP